MLTSSTKNTSGTYGPTKKGKYYLPKPDHNRNSTNRHKSKWAINDNQQFGVFIIAETPEDELFCVENDCYFAAVDNCKEVLGTADERVAKFPSPQNLSDPWHGYPVRCLETQNIPSDELLDKMVEKNVISDITRRRIERKVI